MSDMKFSVLMSVYYKEKPEYLRESIKSVLNQTLLPNEIVLVKDGPLTEDLERVINEYVNNPIFSIVEMKENVGLGLALNTGLLVCKNEIIARMDTDDICVRNRFELQINEFEKDIYLTVSGGQIEEFVDTPSKTIGKRKVPLNSSEIEKFLKKRNPFNHMTVMFKKNAVIEAGNYLEMNFVEDYYLWCRMYQQGCKFSNLKETLVFARVGRDMYKRRGGFGYFKSWIKLEEFKNKSRITNKFTMITTLFERFIVQVILPNSIRGLVFRYFSRANV